jgi:hypothetical protein
MMKVQTGAVGCIRSDPAIRMMVRSITIDPSHALHAVLTVMAVGLMSLFPFATSSKDSELWRCSTIAQALPEMTVLPDGSREARLSLGTMSVTARNRIPGALCAQECLLTLRLDDGKTEKHRFAGPKVLSRSFAYTTEEGQPRRYRVLYFRLREREWVAVGVVERRQRGGRITYEDLSTSVHLDPSDEHKTIFPGDRASIELRRNLDACIDTL